MIGSNNTGSHLSLAALNDNDPAILKAISLESTSWYDPSYSVALTSINGYPANTPFSMDSLIPCSTDGMYSLGTTPPTILFSKTNPSPGSRGSYLTHT